VKAENK